MTPVCRLRIAHGRQQAPEGQRYRTAAGETLGVGQNPSQPHPTSPSPPTNSHRTPRPSKMRSHAHPRP